MRLRIDAARCGRICRIVAVACALLSGSYLVRAQDAAKPPPQNPAKPAAAGRASRQTITLLSTTDIHGHIEPIDYYSNKPANLGLAKIATLVKEQRAEAPKALLLDCGDTTQGTPLAYYFAVKDWT